MTRRRISFLTGKKARLALQEERYIVRVLHPRGRYPAATLGTEDFLYSADSEIAFTVTKTVRLQSYLDGPYTEMDWLTRDELRHLGAILLCEVSGGAKVCFYPVHYYSPALAKRQLNLTTKSAIEQVRFAVLNAVMSPSGTWRAAELHECYTHRYSMIEADRIALERYLMFSSRISTTDNLVLRGLSALMRADMLTRYYEFWEEATTACFVALEASFQLVRKELIRRGHKDPNAKDAAKWLHEEFDQHLGFPEPLDRYFSEFYDQRIMTLHPSSRFGEYPYAPLAHDDYYHLRDSLRAVFGYLLSGEHDRGFLEDVAAAKSIVRQAR